MTTITRLQHPLVATLLATMLLTAPAASETADCCVPDGSVAATIDFVLDYELFLCCCGDPPDCQPMDGTVHVYYEGGYHIVYRCGFGEDCEQPPPPNPNVDPEHWKILDCDESGVDESYFAVKLTGWEVCEAGCYWPGCEPVPLTPTLDFVYVCDCETCDEWGGGGG